MKRIGLAVHAGAGPDSEFVRQNLKAYEKGLADALGAGYDLLEKGGSALDAVEISVRALEDNYIYNAARGASLNSEGVVKMHAAIMNGEDLRSGAGCLLTNIRNPITFVKKILEQGDNVFLGGEDAVQTAREMGLDLEPLAYFITDQQVKEFLEYRKKFEENKIRLNLKSHGTVGAVACDKKGNLASGTSTGGTHFGHPGRIGDTSMIGVGTYANNEACAVSCTGDGECLITRVLAHSIFSLKKFKKISIQETLDALITPKKKDSDPDMGAVSIDPEGNIGIQFNSERMHRAWRSKGSELQVMIYR